MIRTTIKVQRRGDLRARLREVERSTQGPQSVKVGLPAGRSPQNVIEYAVYNHFGTAGRTPRRGGWGAPIPARPFITAALYPVRGRLRNELRAIARSVIRGDGNLLQGMNRLGLWGQDIIQAQIRSNMGPPNSPMTVALKGSSRTLIDDGRLLQSITYEVER